MPLRFPLARVLLILVLGAVASVSTGCASDRAVIAQAQQFHGNLDAAIIKDPVLAGYIQRVGDRIISAAQEMHRQGYGPDRHKAEDSAWMFSGGMQFHLVNSETVNAFTTGGNHMYIYTGLMQQSATEDELAAVMAHEFAHVYGRHVHKGMDRQYAALGAALGLGAIGYAVADDDNRMTYAGAGAALGYLGTNLWNTSLGRDDEEEADKLGFEFYVRAGWDPDKFDDFFQRMIDAGYDKGGKFEQFLSTHPSLSSRVEAARKRAAAVPPNVRTQMALEPVATTQEFNALKTRAVQVGRNMPSDQTLAATKDLLQAMSRSCLTPAVTPDQLQANDRVEQRLATRQQQQQPGR